MLFNMILHMCEAITAIYHSVFFFFNDTATTEIYTLSLHDALPDLGLMPAYTGSALGTKLVAFYPRNTEVPTHHATILLFKPETGEPLVTMDGRLITEVRTAAVSAVGTQRPPPGDAPLLAALGPGGLAARPTRAR